MPLLKVRPMEACHSSVAEKTILFAVSANVPGYPVLFRDPADVHFLHARRKCAGLDTK